MPPPASLRRPRSRSRIWAWIVTSSAVVGSSAISTVGLAGQRHGDHDALAHAAGHLVRIVGGAALGIGDADALQRVHGDLPRLARGCSPACSSTASAIWSPTV